jgi:hypothetical protein
MQSAASIPVETVFSEEPEAPAEHAFKRQLLDGYRFRVCNDPESVAAALDVRRQVYVEDCGYDVPIPDAIDDRSWLLLAEDVATGRPCGTLRITPRALGPLECEDYFRLPPHLQTPRTLEITRFAILREYRKGSTFLPIVSFGLYALTMHVANVAGAANLVIAVKPTRVWTHEWMTFRDTGQVASYGLLGDKPHHLLEFDLETVADRAPGHPFRAFFLGPRLPQLVVPARLPAPGVGVPGDDDDVRIAHDDEFRPAEDDLRIAEVA